MHTGWAVVADGLWAEDLALPPADIREYKLFFNTQNADGPAVAERHGFLLHSDATMIDPEFLADVAKLSLPVDPVKGEELAELVGRLMDVSPEVLRR